MDLMVHRPPIHHVDLTGRIIFEALPSARGASTADLRKDLDALGGLANSPVAAVNVPEIIGGTYDTMAPRRFAIAVQDATGLPSIVNKVTVHEPREALGGWIEATAALGVHHFMFVGGDASSESYPGPALPIVLPELAAKVHEQGGTAGVVTIPGRTRPGMGEHERLKQKQQAGADFAISQIQLDSAAAVDLQKGACAAGVKIPILWSLAPVVRRRDLEFLAWLGVDIPPSVRRSLTGSPTQAARQRRSTEIAADTVREIAVGCAALGVAPGFCIEHVMAANVEAAIEMVGAVADVCREERVQMA